MSAVETDARPQDAGPGARLQAAREAKGLTLEVLATQLKVAPQRLRALEAEAWGELPDRTYARALATAVCRALDVEARGFLAAMPGATPVALERVAEGLNQPIQNSAWSSAGHRVALGLLALLGVLLLVWMTSLGQGLRERLGWPEAAVAPETDMAAAVPGEAVVASASELAPQPTQASSAAVALPVQAASASVFGPDSAPAAASAALPAALPAAVTASAPVAVPSATAALSASSATVGGDLRLALRLRQDSWVQVQEAQGAPLISRLVRAGEQIDLAVARLPVRLVLGNAPGVDLVWRGQPQDLAAYQGQRVARLTLE